MEQIISGFIYLWRDRKHKRYYIGAHWGDPNDGYICGSRWMLAAFKKRPQDFKRRIIATVQTRDDLFVEEARWLQMIRDHEMKSKYYNLIKTSFHWSVGENFNSTCEKISKTTREAMQRPEVRVNLLAGIAKRVITVSEETRKKQSARVSAQWKDVEYKKRVSRAIGAAQKGKPNLVAKGSTWWTDGVNTKRATECPGELWTKGRGSNHSKKLKGNQNSKGKFWWNNGQESKFTAECPGSGWTRGRG